MQVLIVDKSELIIQRLEELLSEAGNIAVLHSAVSCNEALQVFSVNKPDVVVLDNNLTGNGSYELLKEIKENSPQTVVIILSIHLDIHHKQQCMLLGADYFFDKYHEFEKIPGIIKMLGKTA